MPRTNCHLAFMVLSCLGIATLSVGCDLGRDDGAEQSYHFNVGEAEELPLLSEDFVANWDGVPLPMEVSTLRDYAGGAGPQQRQLPVGLTHETFVFSSTTDIIALTSAPGGLFGPFPEDIPLLEEDEISDGFLFSTKVYDENENLVGFGTEQEEQDLANASAVTTFTLTLPGRGTLLLAQEEDFSVFFAEIEDMINNQDFIRTFNPPLSAQTTVDWTGRVVGGTGEFEGAHGIMREIDIVYEINLIDQQVDVTDVLQVLLL